MTNDFVDPHALSLKQETQQLEKRWSELIYRNVNDCLFLLSVEPDECFRFVSANKAFLDVTGLTREKVVGRRIEEITPESAHALVLGKYREALSENRTVTWEEVSVYPNGRRIGEVKVTPLQDEATGQIYLVGAVRDITTLREDEEKLRRSEELSRTLLQSFPSGTVCVLDKDLRYIVAEGAELSRINLGSDELVGRTLYELFTPQLVDFVAPFYRRVFEGETISFELPYDNQVYNINAAPLRNESGDIYAALVVSLNITERKQLEEKLSQSQAELQAIFDCARDAILLTNDEARFVEASPAACALLGYSREELTGLSIWDVTPKQSRTEVSNLREKLIAGGNLSGEYTMVRKDGSPVQIEYNSVANILPGLHLTINRDITARKRTEEYLRESEHRYRSIISNAPLACFIIDREGIFTLVEGKGLDATGLRPGDLIGQSAFDVYGSLEVREHTGKLSAGSEVLRRVLAGETIKGDTHVSDTYFENSFIPVRDADGEIVSVMGVSFDITERVRAAEELRRSEERFRAMIEYGSDIVSIHNAQGQMLYISPSIEHILGYEQGELIGKNMLDYIHPEQRQHTEDEINKVKSSPGAHPSFETRFRHKNGEWVWVECTGNNLLDEPNVGKILFNKRDITERKLTEDALRASEEELRALFAAMSDVIFVFDSEGRYLKVAPTNPDILYREPELLTGKRLHDIFPETTANLFLDYVRKALTTRKRVSAEYSLNIKGQEMWFVATVAPMTEETVVWVARDITDIKQAERALRESENLYRETVENANDIIYTLELDGRYLSVNRAGERITGYTRDEIRQMTFADIIAPEYLDFVRRKMVEKLEDGGETTYELELIAKDKRRIALEINSRLLEKNGVPIAVLGIARDITERKQTEEKLRQTEEQLRQSQKLESVGLLAGGIAHDFNNMLTVINGYSDLILRQLSEHDPLRQKIEEIRNAGEKAGALTYQLLAFSRKQILQTRTLNINEIVSDVSKMLQRLIGEDIDLKVALNERLGHVDTDPGQMAQVLMNLAVNARDAMPSGGKLVIETDNVYLDEAYASQHVAVQSGRYVMLAVSDNGTGIDEKTRERIFEPFYTTKEVGQGTGMGLATVYGIIKQSGGSIWAYSEVGYGTTFKIYLPRVDKEAEGLQEENLDADLSPGTEKILLVEDEDLVRDLSKQILEMCGYTVLEASNGAKALRLCEEERCSIDLLITDVVMPYIGGHELAERLTVSYPSLRVLYISGYTDNAIVHHGVLNEGTNFIQKPFTPASFAKKVRDVLDAT